MAIYKDVEIEGSVCNRASLHNISVLKETLHGYGWENQKVEVAKMNMIIPQIVSAQEENDETKIYFHYPMTCPICGSRTEIIKDNDSEVLYCSNSQCSGRLLNRFEHFMGKKGLDIKGISKATIEKLMDWGWLNTYQDIFLLYQYKEQWIKKSGFGEASVDKILNAIETSKNTLLNKVIAAAGIPEIGTRIAKDLAKHYKTWADFRAETDFSQYDGIGEVMNDKLLSFDYDDLNLDYTINRFLTIEKKDEIEENHKDLENKTFCITGKLNHFRKREVLQNDIEKRGGKVVGAISKNVDYLINNDSTSTSTKNKKAQELGIPIITEEEYLKFDF